MYIYLFYYIPFNSYQILDMFFYLKKWFFKNKNARLTPQFIF